MSDQGIPVKEFTDNMQRLGSAFGKTAGEGLILEFYRVFGAMSPESFVALVDWAIRNLDAPFPSIARLRRGAEELGYLTSDAKADDDKPRVPREQDFPFVYVSCPRCQGTFVVFKSKLAEYAKQDAVFVCANQMHWGCPMTFRARDIAERESGTQNSGRRLRPAGGDK